MRDREEAEAEAANAAGPNNVGGTPIGSPIRNRSSESSPPALPGRQPPRQWFTLGGIIGSRTVTEVAPAARDTTDPNPEEEPKLSAKAKAAALAERNRKTARAAAAVAAATGQKPKGVEGKEEQCSICLNVFQDADECASLPCLLHRLHWRCWTTWNVHSLQAGNGPSACPVCRCPAKPGEVSRVLFYPSLGVEEEVGRPASQSQGDATTRGADGDAGAPRYFTVQRRSQNSQVAPPAGARISATNQATPSDPNMASAALALALAAPTPPATGADATQQVNSAGATAGPPPRTRSQISENSSTSRGPAPLRRGVDQARGDSGGAPRASSAPLRISEQQEAGPSNGTPPPSPMERRRSSSNGESGGRRASQSNSHRRPRASTTSLSAK